MSNATADFGPPSESSGLISLFNPKSDLLVQVYAEHGRGSHEILVNLVLKVGARPPLALAYGLQGRFDELIDKSKVERFMAGQDAIVVTMPGEKYKLAYAPDPNIEGQGTLSTSNGFAGTVVMTHNAFSVFAYLLVAVAVVTIAACVAIVYSGMADGYLPSQAPTPPKSPTPAVTKTVKNTRIEDRSLEETELHELRRPPIPAFARARQAPPPRRA